MTFEPTGIGDEDDETAEDTPAGPSIGERFKRYMAARRDAGLGHRDPDTPETARLAEQLADDTTPNATTCAHCRRDLTRASIHTIQGINVCADIRHCLTRQAEQRKALRPEYGVRVVYTSTRMREEAVSDNADDAREQAAKIAENRNVVSAIPIQRPVGDWDGLGGDRG